MTTVGAMLDIYLEGYRKRNVCDAFERAIAEKIEDIENGISNPKQFFSDLIRKATLDLKLISYSMREEFPETDETNCSVWKSEFDYQQGRIRYDALREDRTRYYYIKGRGNYVHTLEVECRERN